MVRSRKRFALAGAAVLIVALAFGVAAACNKHGEESAPVTTPPSQGVPSPGATPPPSGGTAAAPLPPRPAQIVSQGISNMSGTGPLAVGTNVVAGRVRFAGKPPERKSVTTPDAYCEKQHITEDEIVVGPGGGLQNVLVHFASGVKGRSPPPPTPAVVDQSGCMYRPRVQWAIAGQPVEVRNSDQTLHNVHTYMGTRTVFNQAQIPGIAPISRVFSNPGGVVRFKCDVHPWMNGYVGFDTHPFHAVTDASGKFTIDKVPPGTYKVEAWHERLGTRSADVTVTDGKPAEVTLEFTAP